MKNNIILTLLALSFTVSIHGQSWRTEIKKHEDKTITDLGYAMDAYFDDIGKTRENKYHQFMRWYEYALSHQSPTGRSFNHIKKNENLLEHMERKITKENNNKGRHYHANWKPVSPNNFIIPGSGHPAMGRINCIAKPTPNGNLIYAGTATGGVWKSYNNGASWQPLWDGMVQTGVSSIVIDYTNLNHLLVLTGDADSAVIPSAGVYHSYDGGSTWSACYEFDMQNLSYGYKLIQSKTNSQHYMIAKNGTSYIKFHLFNGLVETGSLDGICFDIEYQTNNDNILWGASTSGLYKKEGNGFWSKVSHPNLPDSLYKRSAVAMAPSDEDIIYFAAANSDTGFYGLYKSIDQGDNWFVVYDTSDTDIMTYQCGYNFTLDVSPDNSEKVYFGTGYFYESVDGGASFTHLNSNIHSDIHNAYHIGSRQYVCTDGGISYRLLGAPTFVGLNNGLLCTQFYNIDVLDEKIIGGTQDNGTMVWQEGDATGYRRIASDGLDCHIDTENPSIIFASTQATKQISTNGGNSFSYVMGAEWYDPMEVAVDDPDKYLFHAIDELKVSTDGGFNFPVSHDIFGKALNVRAISQCHDNPNVIYVAKGDSLAVSLNFNAVNPTSVSWDYPYTLASDIIGDILVHPDNCNEVYIVRRGYNTNQVLRSIDYGDDPEPYNEGIEDIPIYCIYYDHVNGNGYYIGTEFGVFYRNSSMDAWIPFSTYLPRVPVYDLKITDNHVYAATHGRGVWKSEGYKTCETNLVLTQANDPTNGSPSGQQVHKVSGTILTNRVIQGNADTKVHYQAGNYIDLQVGFHARQFNEFVAKAAGCLED